MKTYAKLAKSDEQKLLSNLLPRRMLRSRQKVFWRIDTEPVCFELVAIGRIPCGIDVTEKQGSKWLFHFLYIHFYFEPSTKPLSLAILPLDTTNDIFFNEKHERITGKYRVVTKAFTGGSPKFEAVQVHWDNVVDWFKTNCVDVEQLGLTLQTATKTSFAIGLPNRFR